MSLPQELLPGGLTLVASLILVPAVRSIARVFGWISQPRSDRWNAKPVALCGGIGIFFAYLLGAAAMVPFKNQLWWLVLTGAAMFGLGLIDDFIHIKPASKLIGQIICAALAIYSGHLFHIFHSETANILLSFFWIVAITNALNLLDNMDGLAAGIGIIASAFLAAVFWNEGNMLLQNLSIVLCFSILGFLVYNFYPATIFMGDCGSLFIGCTLAVLSMKTRSMGGAITAIAVPALVLSVPILDVIYVSITRILRGQSPAQGGKDHTSHCLISLGLSEPRAALTLYLLAAASGGLAFWISQSPDLPKLFLLPAVGVLFTLLGVYLANMSYDLHPRDTAAIARRSPWVTNLLLQLSFKRRVFEIILDFALISLSYYFAYELRFDFSLRDPYMTSFTKSLPLVIAATYGCFFIAGIYRGIWRFTGLRDALRFLAGSVLSMLVAVVAVVLIYRFENFSRSVFLIFGLLLFITVSVTRLSFKVLGVTLGSLREPAYGHIPVLMYGAGEGGELALREIQKQNGHWNWKPIGFIDDDQKKYRLKIHGVPILGSHKDLARIYKRSDFKQLIICSSQIPPETLKAALHFCRKHDIEVKRFRWVVEPVLN
jgi:UDP-GlcNAc:undecaprenyl-phosphate GlcNAc-1-phosphate transferase